MKLLRNFVALVVALTSLLSAQQSASPQSAAVVPQLVSFAGKASDAQGKPVSGIAGITFSIYKDQYDGAPLWTETQNVTADTNGNYTVQLGSASSQGLPLALFSSGEARWLGVRVNGGEEQPRVLLLSVPYALKAADAQTLAGLPASAFALAASPTANIANGATASSGSETASVNPATSSDVTTTGGTANTIPMFTSATNIQNSIITQTGTTAVNVKGKLNLPALGAATASAGFDSRPQDFVASAYNSTSKAAVAQTFQWQAEPLNNDKSTATGTLNLLFGAGTATPEETGLKISSKGVITFATGQTFPGGGSGTITGVKAGTDLTGGGTSGTVTLNLDTTKVPQLAASNTFSGYNTFNAGLTATSDATALVGSTSGEGYRGVYGIANGTSGGSDGVYGQSYDPTGAGVAGVNEGVNGIGVYGQASGGGGEGVYGQLGTLSAVGQGSGGGAAIWGDGGGPPTNATGVLGSAADNNAGFFINNSSSGDATVTIIAQAAGTPPLQALGKTGSCSINDGGDLSCTGSKNAVVPIDSGTRIVALSAIESPKNWFEDFGSAQLTNGTGVVTLDAEFIQTVNTETEYQVFLTPYGDCKGLYVSNRTATSFEVRELGGGRASIGFGYRITALRKKYENVRFADHTHDMDSLKKMRERIKTLGAKPVPHDPMKRPTIVRDKEASPTPMTAER